MAEVKSQSVGITRSMHSKLFLRQRQCDVLQFSDYCTTTAVKVSLYLTQAPGSPKVFALLNIQTYPNSFKQIAKVLPLFCDFMKEYITGVWVW